ncbi:MAG: class I SAM-dependent methyltransferase [Alphaproteobacteria bacterium]|nr:class I SAM-dependent methyltransferase [Alphaproteobacteria bacterium]
MAPWFTNLLAQPAEGVILIALLLGGGLILGYAIRTGVPPMPTGPTVRRAMFDFLPERVDGTVYDLGSGWGGVAVALADRYPGNPVIGIELSPLPWLWSRLRLALRPRPNLIFRRGDFLTMPLGDAGAITCYLMIGAMTRLAVKLSDELEPGTVVVSHAFALPGWEPETVAIVRDVGSVWVYRYVAGRSVASSRVNEQGDGA